MRKLIGDEALTDMAVTPSPTVKKSMKAVILTLFSTILMHFPRLKIFFFLAQAAPYPERQKARHDAAEPCAYD